ncbi:645_t:CDS:2 [Acaulospora morrowiae]|uniref:645_t:CDS:1 n=1 Tax=Acaulospora morrowiae TaxID=94023 RepID=A0A9N8ZLI6_9GLOM|nr:645_t:CDS:2 [Acaulospora morrowiae]
MNNLLQLYPSSVLIYEPPETIDSPYQPVPIKPITASMNFTDLLPDFPFLSSMDSSATSSMDYPGIQPIDLPVISSTNSPDRIPSPLYNTPPETVDSSDATNDEYISFLNSFDGYYYF